MLNELGWMTGDLRGAYEVNLWDITSTDVQNAVDKLAGFFPLVKDVEF